MDGSGCRMARRARGMSACGAPVPNPRGGPRPRPDFVRFQESVEPDMFGGCLLWAGGCGTAGYGTFTFGGINSLAHRVAWILEYGEIPDGMWVLHRCDVRPCVNTKHLFLGTGAENTADMWAKGRGRTGQTPVPDEIAAQIIAAKDLGEFQRVVADRFGVNQTTVGRLWARAEGHGKSKFTGAPRQPSSAATGSPR